MGASLSSLTESNGSSNGGGPGLGDIPESCVACVFLYLTPPEICNLARLNRAFRGAASADSVWESKLPSNYHDILDLMPPERHQNLTKKDIFALLSRPFPFDDGNKEVWLDRVTGRVCMSISAKGMVITGIEDRRYWNWVPTEESSLQGNTEVWVNKVDLLLETKRMKLEELWERVLLDELHCLLNRENLRVWFHVVAYLQQIWWFEVDGVIKFPFPADIYTLSFRIHLGKFSKRLGWRVCSFEHTHGWDIKPVRFEFSTSDGQQASTQCCLDATQQDNANGNNKRGCWMEYKVGQFIVKESDPTTEVRFSMKQIDCTHSKGGLCVDCVSIIPSDLKERRRIGVLK